MDPIIKTENLSVTYNLGKSSEFAALRQVDVKIYPGEYVIFFGPSGCGKSTLLYCMTGLEILTQGEVFVEGNPLSDVNSREMVNLRRKKIGMVFQAYNLVSTLTVLDNVLLPNIFGGLAPKTSVKRAKFLLERFGIANLSHRYPGELSGGQQQRVAIARSFIYDPPILFADEPVGNLDSESAETVINLLSEFNKKDKKTIILVTHDSRYLYYAHRVFYIKDGKIVREVINPDRKSIAPPKEKSVSSEIESLGKTYPNLSKVQIKAKALSRYLLNFLDEKKVERIEKFIKKRILGEIGDSKLMELLDRPFEEGGAGFYRQTAESFTRKVEEILIEAEFLQKEIPQPKKPLTQLDARAKSVRRYLLDKYQGNLKKEEEVLRMERFIRLRLERKIGQRKFQKYLDLPFKKGGVGLNRATAKNFAKKLEIIITAKSK